MSIRTRSTEVETIAEEEIDRICQAIIDSPVDTSRALQDKVMRLLNLHTPAIDLEKETYERDA